MTVLIYIDSSLLVSSAVVVVCAKTFNYRQIPDKRHIANIETHHLKTAVYRFVSQMFTTGFFSFAY